MGKELPLMKAEKIRDITERSVKSDLFVFDMVLKRSPLPVSTYRQWG